MNIVFHCVAATGILSIVSDQIKSNRKIITLPILFCLGIISHGALDYIPHQYPIKSSIDVVIGLIWVVLLGLIVKAPYRLAVLACISGALLPDIVDHSPEISNKYLHTEIKVIENIFPWHWTQFSGSLYNDNGTWVSHINHFALVFFVLLLIFWNRKHWKSILR